MQRSSRIPSSPFGRGGGREPGGRPGSGGDHAARARRMRKTRIVGAEEEDFFTVDTTL